MHNLVHLSGAVMAHPDRAVAAERTARQAPDVLTVVFDPIPSGPPTAARTALLAWSSVPQGATHHVVLQDDVVLAEGFFEHARRSAQVLPDDAIAFYANWNSRNGAAVRMAALSGTDWARGMEEYAPCVALMLPAPIAHGYRAYAEAAEAAEAAEQGWPYDVLMHRYLKTAGVRLHIAVPNTAEHSGVPSIAGNAAHGLRRSALYTSPARLPTSPDRATAFPLVPFYKHSAAYVAARRGERWEYLPTERALRRSGVPMEECRTGFEASRPAALASETGWCLWLTAFAMGFAVDSAPAPEPVREALATLGPGGVCDELPPEEISAAAPAMAELARAGFEAGLALRRQAPARHRAEVARQRGEVARQRARPVAVIGTAGTFAEQLGYLLTDLGHDVYFTSADAARGLAGAEAVVHMAGLDGTQTEQLLRAATKAGVARFIQVVLADPVQAGAAAPDQAVPMDGGTAVSILRTAALIGPYAPTASLVAQWLRSAWTRRPLSLVPGRVHQVTHYRDLAAAIDAILRGDPRSAVYSIASKTMTEDALADAVCRASRATARTRDSTAGSTLGRVRVPLLSTRLAESRLGWRPSAPIDEGMREFAQWLAYDTECS